MILCFVGQNTLPKCVILIDLYSLEDVLKGASGFTGNINDPLNEVVLSKCQDNAGICRDKDEKAQTKSQVNLRTLNSGSVALTDSCLDGFFFLTWQMTSSIRRHPVTWQNTVKTILTGYIPYDLLYSARHFVPILGLWTRGVALYKRAKLHWLWTALRSQPSFLLYLSST